MSTLFECWWDSAPELMEPDWLAADVASPFGPFSGITTNPMLMLDAFLRQPLRGHADSGWDLYLACAARSAHYLTSRAISIPFCVQLDPRSAFDRPAMIEQAKEIRARIPDATIKVPLTSAGIDVIGTLVAAGIQVNGTWGFCVAQLVAAARAIADATRGAGLPAAGPAETRSRNVLTIMEGRLGDLGLSAHVGAEERAVRASEAVVFEAAYGALLEYRNDVTLLVSSLRAGPEGECWHYADKIDRKVVLTLPPALLRQVGLPSPGADYGRADDDLLERARRNDAVRRYAAADGFAPAEFDLLPPLARTREEAIRAMTGFEELATGR
jgi:transaldolase